MEFNENNNNNNSHQPIIPKIGHHIAEATMIARQPLIFLLHNVLYNVIHIMTIHVTILTMTYSQLFIKTLQLKVTRCSW